MQRLIVAVGGTGQMILHYYAQLVLLGVIKEKFEALVIDSDDCMESLQCLSRFLDRAAEALGPSRAAENVPKIRYCKVAPDDTSATIARILTAGDLPSQPGFHHPAQAFFSRETLQQAAGQGLYARPAVSAVISLGDVLADMGRLQFDQQCRVVLVASCIGGTGGGLAIPLLDRLQERAGPVQASIRAVLLGRYFDAEGEQITDQTRRFDSNKTLFFRAAEASLDRLHSYAFIETPRMPQRIADSEKKAHHLQWPAEKTPYWQAVRTLEYLLSNTTLDVREHFTDRQARDNEMEQATLRLAAAESALQTGLGRVQTICDHQLPHLVEDEAFVKRFWGPSLAEFLAAFWRFVRRANPNSPDVWNGLGRKTAQAMASLWRPAGGGYGLASVFPDVRPSKAAVQAIKGIGWIAPQPESPHQRFRNPEAASGLIASAILYCALRHGGT